MADRTSAGLFGEFFCLLAADPTDQHVKWARDLWRNTLEYDFSPCQMGCDEALSTLSLARRRVDPRWPDDGPVWWYGPEGEDER
jgi:hypothetical protein